MQVHANEFKSEVWINAGYTISATAGDHFESLVYRRKLEEPQTWNADDLETALHIVTSVYQLFPSDLEWTLPVIGEYETAPLSDWSLFLGVALAVRFYSREKRKPVRFHVPHKGLYATFKDNQWTVTAAGLAMQMTCDSTASTASMQFEFSREWYMAMMWAGGNEPGTVQSRTGIGEAPPFSRPFWTNHVLSEEVRTSTGEGFSGRQWMPIPAP